MTLALELGGIDDPYVRRALERLDRAFPVTASNAFGAGPTSTATLPTGTLNGQDFYYQVSGGGVWHFKYNSTSTKWDFAGGPELAAVVTTSESKSGGTYGALATAGPSVTVPFVGDYFVTVEAAVGVNNATLTRGWMSFDIGGTGAVDADGMEGGTFQFSSFRRTVLKTSVAASTILLAKYKSDDGATTASFKNRRIAILPVRVG